MKKTEAPFSTLFNYSLIDITFYTTSKLSVVYEIGLSFFSFVLGFSMASC